jgi:hypothetical protein
LQQGNKGAKNNSNKPWWKIWKKVTSSDDNLNTKTHFSLSLSRIYTKKFDR